MRRIVDRKLFDSALIAAQALELRQVTLSRIACEMVRPYRSKPNESLSFLLKESCELMDDDATKGHIHAVAKMTILASFERDSNSKRKTKKKSLPAFQAKVEMMLHYAITEGARPNKEALSAFAKLNGLYNAWPYLRELISDMSTRTGYPPLLIPPLIIIPKPRKQPKSLALAPVNAAPVIAEEQESPSR